MQLTKYSGNPILSPDEQSTWESLVTCNPAAWYENGTFYLLYRAAADDDCHTIQLGLATSKDGFHFTRHSDRPFFPYVPGNFDGGPEDPRLCRLEGVLYMTYAYRPYLPGRYWLKSREPVAEGLCPPEAPVLFRQNLSATGLAFGKDIFSLRRAGRITRGDVDNRDVTLFPERINGQYVRLERPMEYCGKEYGCEGPSIWLNFSNSLLDWEDAPLHLLLPPGRQKWNNKKTGGSCPPLKTEIGWLVIYHAVGEDGLYRVGVMLLDLEDPRIIRALPEDFIMEPEYPYETEGFYQGCVFPTGNVIVGDTLYVYYGAGDVHCGVATCKLAEMMEYLTAHIHTTAHQEEV